MTEKFMGVHLDEEDIQKFKDIARKERTTLKALHKKIILDYNKIHGDGNPGFTMDQFLESDIMKAVPAVFRTREDWQLYIEEIDEKSAQELLWQIQTIGALTKNKVNHGTTHVRFS